MALLTVDEAPVSVFGRVLEGETLSPGCSLFDIGTGWSCGLNEGRCSVAHVWMLLLLLLLLLWLTLLVLSSFGTGAGVGGFGCFGGALRCSTSILPGRRPIIDCVFGFALRIMGDGDGAGNLGGLREGG